MEYILFILIILFIIYYKFIYLHNEDFHNIDNLDNLDNLNNLNNYNFDYDPDNYIRRRLLKGRDYVKKTFTNKDIDIYRDNHFRFHNKINQSSKYDLDVVDKLNENDNMKNISGCKISEIFNSLTNNLPKSDFNYYNINKDEDNIVDGHNGEYFTNTLWNYDNEKNINGGTFYNNIIGFENINTQQIL